MIGEKTQRTHSRAKPTRHDALLGVRTGFVGGSDARDHFGAELRGAMRAIVLLTVQLLQPLDALKCGPMVSRRAAVAGLFGLPAAACAGNPLDFDSQVRVFLLR